MAGNIKSGVKIFNVTGSMTDGSTVSLTASERTISGAYGSTQTINIGSRIEMIMFHNAGSKSSYAFSSRDNFLWVICTSTMYNIAKDTINVPSINGLTAKREVNSTFILTLSDDRKTITCQLVPGASDDQARLYSLYMGVTLYTIS